MDKFHAMLIAHFGEDTALRLLVANPQLMTASTVLIEERIQVLKQELGEDNYIFSIRKQPDLLLVSEGRIVEQKTQLQTTLQKDADFV